METIPQHAPSAAEREDDGAAGNGAAPATPEVQGWVERVLHPVAVAGLLVSEFRLLPDGHGPSGIGWVFGVQVSALLTVAAVLMAYDALGAWAFDDARRPDAPGFADRLATGLSRSALLAALVWAPCRLVFLVGA